MGSQNSVSEWDIKFIQNLEDPHYGNIQIYKNQQGKYIMMLRRTFMRNQSYKPSSPSSTEYKDNGFHQILSYQQSNPIEAEQFLTPILHQTTKIQNLCVMYQIVDTYCEYFNFTLADMIRYKKDMDREEIWHCFYWVVGFVGLCEERGWMLGDGVRLERVFVTLKGLPTVSIHHMVKISTIDQVLEKQRNMLEEAALCILQLACMTTINENDNLELFLRKCQKFDAYLGELLGLILRKSIAKKGRVGQKEVLEKIQGWLAEGKIGVSREIKLNKFKYIIPKPEIKSELNTEHSINNPGQPTQKQVQPHPQNQKQNQKQKQKPVHINSLHGRKNHEHLSLRGSNKREHIDFLENKVPSLQTPMNKTMTIKNSLLIDEIESRKKASERQKEKLSQRKELIMNFGGLEKGIGVGVKGMTTPIGSFNGNANTNSNKSGTINKENILGNSIREVRPSYNRKQSWTKKIINEHLKQSYRS